MARNLVIVESPAKAGTIAKYLGPDFEVLASFGHIRDLPASKLGVDVEASFAPQYVIPPKSRKALNALKSAAKDKEVIYLATDLDREGEAIAWHIAEALELSSTQKQVKRITFDEITKSAVQYAVEHPRTLKMDLVDAQQARRVLDRLVGYTLSPVLWRKLYRGLSAGRVQSAALRLIVEREREREQFVSQDYWSISGRFLPGNASLKGELVEFEGQKIEQFTFTAQERVDQVTTYLQEQSYVLAAATEKPIRRKPSAPYTTSTLQQQAGNSLGFSAKRTMQLAQHLYEKGYITYMRTDSVSLSTEAVQAIRQHVQDSYGAEALPSEVRTYVAKSSRAQEAHEAIRPTDPTKYEVSTDLAEQRLYELIWKRAVASQMADAELMQQAYTITGGRGVFRATGQRMIKPGFYAVYDRDDTDSVLPVLASQTQLDVQEISSESHATEPPPRYTESSLVKVLEEQGIGRPSTYAPTISTLVDRGYVTVESRRIAPEQAGLLVTDLLVEHFPEIVNVTFTASMEERLDRVAEGSESYSHILEEFWTPFSDQVKTREPLIPKQIIAEETDEVCEICGAPMVVKMSRFGKFLACSRFPECRSTQPFQKPAPTGMTCPICGALVIEKKARRGVFFGCARYPECTFALWKKEHLIAKVEALEAEGELLPHKEAALAAFAELGLDSLPLPVPRYPKKAEAAKKKKVAKPKPATRKAPATSAASKAGAAARKKTAKKSEA